MENEDLPLQIKEADAALLKAEAHLQRTRNSFNRYRQLKGLDAISAERYDEAASQPHPADLCFS